MHEMSLCESILQICEDEARRQGFKRVTRVRLEIGRLSGAEPEAMRFSFDAVTRGSLAEGAVLEIIDMPGTVVQWTETVFNEAAVCFAMMELDMRSAQNALRLIRALKAEALPLEKMRYILNRAPKFTDLSGKARAKRMAESLDIEFEIMLPDGTAQVTHGNDHGLPLADVAPKNPLLKEIRKMASAIAAECRLDSKAAA
jgi:hydrogenase nickel insertion protein HypA